MAIIKRSSRGFLALLFEVSIVILAISIIVLIFFKHINSSEYQLPEEQNTSDDIVIGLRVEEINWNGETIFPIENWKKDYAKRFNVPLVSISLDYIYVSQNYLSYNNIEQVCLSKIIVIAGGDNIFEENLTKEDLCSTEGINYFFNQSTNYATLLYNVYDDNYIDPYYFPFDKRTLSFGLSVDARLLDASNQEVASSIQPQVNANISSNKGRESWILENTNALNDLKLTLHRPIMYPTLSYIMLPVILIAIISLLFLITENKKKNNDDVEADYWEVAIGILGIWSIREVLLPDFIDGPTIVEDIILAFYIFLSFIILYIFIRSLIKRLRKKEKV